MATLSSIIPLPAAARTRTSFTATQNQTTFSFTYAVGFLEVFLNGVLLNSGDLTATDGTTFVLNTGVDANDIVEAITHRLVSIGTASAFSGTLPVANGGTGTTSATFVDLTSNVTSTLPVVNGGTGVTTSTGTGNVVLSTNAVLTTPALGTPSAIVLTSGTGLPLTTGVTGTLPVVNGGTGATTTGNALISLGAQAALVSGTSIKTINSLSLLGSGDIAVGAGVVRVARTSDITLTSAENGNLIDITSGTFTQTFTAAATLGPGWFVYLRNSGTGDITLDPNGSETIDSLTSFVIYPGETRLVTCSGTAFFSIVLEFGFKEFTSTGTFIAPPGVSGYIIDAFGGGGGGGRGSSGDSRSGPGGGGGAHAQMSIDPITAGTSITVSVGAGGTAGTAGGGGNGGTSSFGTQVYAYGGAGGTAQGTPGGGTGSAGGGAAALNEYEAGGGWPNLRIASRLGGQAQVDVQIFSQVSGGGAQARNGGYVAAQVTGFSAEWGGGSGAAYMNQASVGGAGGSSMWGGGGGGSGGGNGFAGGAGGATGVWQTGGGGAAGANGVAGTAGAAGVGNRGGAGGGGGGSGAAGGAGGFPGGGGGGGGYGNAGEGAAGGAGRVFIKMI